MSHPTLTASPRHRCGYCLSRQPWACTGRLLSDPKTPCAAAMERAEDEARLALINARSKPTGLNSAILEGANG